AKALSAAGMLARRPTAHDFKLPGKFLNSAPYPGCLPFHSTLVASLYLRMEVNTQRLAYTSNFRFLRNTRTPNNRDSDICPLAGVALTCGSSIGRLAVFLASQRVRNRMN